MISELHYNFSFHTAKTMLDEIQFQRNNYHYFLGNNSIKTEFPINTEQDLNKVRNNILFLDRLLPINVSLGIKKYVWTKDTIYDQWNHTIDMSTKQFYVITKDLKVYKCLDNNNFSKSVFEPSGNDLYPFTTSDGYMWKYMYHITDYHYDRFTTPEYIPVRKALSEQFYTYGAISSVVVDSGGRGYEDNYLTRIRVSYGNAILLPQIDSNGSIIGVTIVNGGRNYTTPPILTLEVPGGGTPTWRGKYGNSTAILTATVFEGAIVNVAIVDPGINYPRLSKTQILVQGDGTGAQVMPIVYRGSIVEVVVLNGGTGYNYMKMSVIGSGTGASLRAIPDQSFLQTDQTDVEQVAVDGAIYSIQVKSGGSNYAQTTRIVIDGDGSGAEAELVIENGTITRCIMKSYGSGYSWATPKLLGIGNGRNAELYCILPPAGGHGANAPHELFSNTLLITTSTRDSIASFLSEQIYNQIGIVVGLRDYENNLTRVSSKYNTYTVKLNNTTDLSRGDILSDSINSFIVVQIDGAKIWLQALDSNTLNLGILTNASMPNLQYRVTEILERPIINIKTGQILCLIDDIDVQFSTNQTITIKTAITF